MEVDGIKVGPGGNDVTTQLVSLMNQSQVVDWVQDYLPGIRLPCPMDGQNLVYLDGEPPFQSRFVVVHATGVGRNIITGLYEFVVWIFYLETTAPLAPRIGPLLAKVSSSPFDCYADYEFTVDDLQNTVPDVLDVDDIVVSLKVLP